MKTNYLLSLLMLTLFTACLEDEDDFIPIDFGNDTVITSAAVLQIDYQTLTFEGGYFYTDFELPYDNTIPQDSFPLTAVYAPPGDFGSLAYYFDPIGSETIGDTLFYGSIVWAGRGDLLHPAELEPVESFEQVATSDFIPLPDNFTDLTPFDPFEAASEEAIFGAVSQLRLVRDAVNSDNTRIGWFFYPRSVGVGDPADWDYYVVILY